MFSTHVQCAMGKKSANVYPVTPKPPQPSSSSSSEEEEDKPAPPRQQQSRPRGTEKRKLPLSPDAPAEFPRKKLGKTKHLSPEEESEEDDTKPKLGKVARKVHRAMAPYFTGKSRGSKIRNIVLGPSLDAYVDEYGQYIFCPEGTAKMQENAVSKISRAKVFLKYLMFGWTDTTYWNFEFLFNTLLLKSYPAVLRKAGLAPTTIILYVGQAISFVEYFRATPPKHSRITGGQTVVVIRELRKLLKDLNRTVLGHQAMVKQAKGKRLVPREDLARCQALARAKMASLLEDIEKAPPRDPKPRYRFFGYLAAYLSAIYGHRMGVMEHKTVRKFGTAQIYLEAEEYGWCRTWLRLRARTVPTNG
ncbi:hypothetical protein D5F01_LYC23775 [Larimichthys crocea]|uniref:Uncharacterized protein n=1 Tax=Larimichthys crocea TaxID=215358 RepID=A0A6G0HFZ8_LARCR|nr:hypothetical protein D5F01_LYC23775 [Larimichthys crocea]